MAKRKRDPVFTPIEVARTSVGQRVNLVGAIVEYGVGEKSKGTDWYCSLKIVDESYQGHCLTINVFAESMDELPRIKLAGDVILFSEVEIKSHRTMVYGYLNKKVSTFALYEGKSGRSSTPYHASSSFGHVRPERGHITSLRTWLLNFNLDSSGSSETILPLSQIGEGKCFDLVCKILKVYEISKDAWVLYLWDGTDAPPLSCRTKLNDEDILKNPLPLQLEASSLPRDVLREFPTVGTVLRVIVDQDSEELARRLPCRWVKFLDFVCEQRSGLWCYVLKSSTKLRILSDEDRVVADRQSVHKHRMNTKWGRAPFSATRQPFDITVTDHGHAPFTTLMDVLTYKEVTAKFRCVVRVVAICPWRVEDFRQPEGKRLYRIMLTVEDPTARIHVYIYGVDGETFYDGYPSDEVLKIKRNKLLGIPVKDGVENLDAPRNPPWIKICLKSYHIDKSDKWGTRQYRIFDTKLVS